MKTGGHPTAMCVEQTGPALLLDAHGFHNYWRECGKSEGPLSGFFLYINFDYPFYENSVNPCQGWQGRVS